MNNMKLGQAVGRHRAQPGLAILQRQVLRPATTISLQGESALSKGKLTQDVSDCCCQGKYSWARSQGT